MRIAYLINQYPKVSHSFIRREILALEASGVVIERYAVRGWDDAVTDPADERERERTRYLLAGGGTRLILAGLRQLGGDPRRFFKALKTAWRLSRGGDRGLMVCLIYLLEASLLVQWLRSSRADHLHCHFGTNPAAVGLLARELGGPSFSFTVHGPEEFDKPAQLKLAEKVSGAAFVVAISSFGKSQLFRWIDSRQWVKCHVVRCGLDASFHAQAGLGGVGPDPGMRLVCVGRLCEQKGQLLLIEALAVLAHRGIRCELVLAGDGEMRTQIEARTRDLQLQDAVRITGWISGDQVREELLAARALVLPSFAEGLPVVLMEALSLERPVISTYVAGIPELVEPGVNGWLTIAGDVHSLADAMADCLSSAPSQLHAMGKAGRARVLERHDIVKEAARLQTHFEQAVAVGGAQP